MADKAEKAAKLISAATTGPIMSVVNKLPPLMPPVLTAAFSSPLAALEAEMRALRADCLAAACSPKMLGCSPLFDSIYSLGKAYQSDLNAKVHSMLEGWRQHFDPLAENTRMMQAAYSYNSQRLRESFKPVEMLGALSMPESILKAHTVMQTVAGYANSHAAQLTQIKDFATSFNVNEITALTAGLFPKTVAEYLRANPLTKAEWEEAARGSYADDAEQDLAEVADVLDAPEQNRWQIIRLIWSIFFLILLAAGGQTMVADVQGFAARTLLNFISAISLTWASALVPEVLQRWKSSTGSPPPLAVIVAADSRDVPVRKTGKPNSAILHLLPVGTLIPLAKEGTKEMKAVVADIDDNGEVIEVAWISRRNLKRIKMKQAYALKKMLPPR